jgi:hypothetical protein
MVALLAFDPFLQSMIQFEGQLDQITASNTSLSKVVRLDIGKAVRNSSPYINSIPNTEIDVASYAWSDPKPDLGFTASVIQGFANTSQSSATVSAVCGSGNCSWPAYNSIGVCSSCADISSRVSRKRRMKFNNPILRWSSEFIDSDDYTSDCIYVDGQGNECFLLSADGKSVSDNQTDSTYSTNPKHSTVFYNLTYYFPSVGFTNEESASLNASADWVMVVNGTSDPLETISFRNFTTLLAAFVILKASDSYINSTSAWNETSPVATECSLYFCVSEYNVDVVNGAVEQQAIRPTQFERSPTSLGNFSNPVFINSSIALFDGGAVNATIATEVVDSWFDSIALWSPQGPIFSDPRRRTRSPAHCPVVYRHSRDY